MSRWFWIGFIGLLILTVGLLDPAIHPFPRCPFLTLTGFQCPGCGSQRALHQLMHGNFVDSMKLNPLLIPGSLYVLIGYMSSFLFKNSYDRVRKYWFGRNAAYVITGIIVLFWIGRNIIV